MRVYDSYTGQELRLNQPIRTRVGVVRLLAKKGILLNRYAIVRVNGGNPVSVPLELRLFYPGRALRITGVANFGR